MKRQEQNKVVYRTDAQSVMVQSWVFVLVVFFGVFFLVKVLVTFFYFPLFHMLNAHLYIFLGEWYRVLNGRGSGSVD